MRQYKNQDNHTEHSMRRSTSRGKAKDISFHCQGKSFTENLVKEKVEEKDF